MIDRNAEPIAEKHRPVYRPISIGPRRHEPEAILETMPPHISIDEQDRIWSITRQTAEGCGVPTIAPSEYVAPDGDAA